MAFNTTPPSRNDTRTGIAGDSGNQARAVSTAIAMTMILAMVPTPGLLRKGIHMRSTTTPVTAEASPMLIPVRIASP
ncbi:Uncharacterised protein [Mycobacteroides abscessus subsp. abscessus]|nr:Uncharacterised protein [Mycobacteroides abscessus subsp. abscessus]SKV85515.1 Uncharacterised protein [Mycobacteroides abscessus subsp. abscessus]SKW36966.1 Uncharacterised protein [Mycobacteroides abscessus subsp. abscessus]